MIKLIDINNVEWDNYVKKCSVYEPFYLSAYVKAFMQESEENGIPKLFIYENNDEYAINVIFCRDISKSNCFLNIIETNKYFDITSPYGYGGFIGNINNYDLLNNEYINICKDNGFVCEFVRFNLFNDYWKHYYGDVETRTHNVVRELNTNLDDIWMDFKQKVRKNVKHACNSGLKILLDENGDKLEDFMQIYYDTMKRTNADKKFYFSKKFFNIINEMHGNYVYFYAVYDDKIISAELVIFGKENCYSYLGGTDNSYFDLRPNDFLKYEIIKWAKVRGLNNFVLGGGYGSDDGIFQYKSCLAPHGIINFYIGKNIFDMEKYNYLVSVRKNIDFNNEFFPLYRS